jgi:hypothetical protein
METLNFLHIEPGHVITPACATFRSSQEQRSRGVHLSLKIAGIILILNEIKDEMAVNRAWSIVEKVSIFLKMIICVILNPDFLLLERYSVCMQKSIGF